MKYYCIVEDYNGWAVYISYFPLQDAIFVSTCKEVAMKLAKIFNDISL